MAIIGIAEKADELFHGNYTFILKRYLTSGEVVEEWFSYDKKGRVQNVKRHYDGIVGRRVFEIAEEVGVKVEGKSFRKAVVSRILKMCVERKFLNEEERTYEEKYRKDVSRVYTCLRNIERGKGIWS